MDEAGIVRFPGHLDPRAQEFRPRTTSLQNQISFLQPQLYYPYQSSYPSTGVQVMHFYDGWMGYQSSPSVAYVRPTTANPPPLPPTLPTPSAAATRALLLSSVPTDVSEATVERELEVFGDVRAVQMERLQEGIVTVHFYDLRHAEEAMTEIREQHMQQQSRLRQHYDALLKRNSWLEGENFAAPVPPPARGLIAGRAVWAQFTVPGTLVGPDGHNQGTLVVFNLDLEVSSSELKEIFEAYGPVKELRETPLKRHQRFVEFFDIRDAARALSQMNGKEIHGKHVVIEFSRPGGQGRRFLNAGTTPTTAPNISPADNEINCRSNHHTRNIKYPSPQPPPPPPLPPRLFNSSSCDPLLSHISKTQHQAKKPSLSTRGNGNGNRRSSHGGAVAAAGAIAALSLNVVGNGIEGERDYNSSPRNVRRINNNPSVNGKFPRSRSWKGRHKSSDSHFLINEDAIMESNCVDSRTTVMIKNIPNKYSQKLLLNMLDNHCIHCNEQNSIGDDQPLSSYDFVYLPIDFNNKCNVGYGFVNLTSPQATWRLYKAFHMQPWEVFNSKKICEVTYARLQGLEALKEHFKNSKFACETDEYLPVVFSPPRDGKQLTEPLAIGGHPKAVNRRILVVGMSDGRERKDDCDEMEVGDRVDGGEEGGNWNGVNDDDDDDENDGGPRLSHVNSSHTGSDASTAATPPNGCLLSTEPRQQPKDLSCAQILRVGVQRGGKPNKESSWPKGVTSAFFNVSMKYSDFEARVWPGNPSEITEKEGDSRAGEAKGCEAEDINPDWT